ncbi:electron transfer flavoprotein alpha subunit [Janthinobacterium sp. CG_23.3]|uniref:electron transfer flavoprotein subunit alpha/FixB family protein n=1 Tax=Janthinobacterium sp. CG_23.3 TaxID=3349634 RepID=UPI0038D47769
MEHQSSIPRINPRRPYVIAASGLKRIVLGQETGSRELHHGGHAAAAKPLRSARPATAAILVLLHSERGGLDEHARQTIAAATLLADADTAVVVAVLGGCAEPLGALGADVGVQLPQLGGAGYLVEARLAQALALVEQYRPRHILLPERDADADLGRRLAARSGASIATDVVELTRETACRIVPGARFARCALPRIILLARHAADARLPYVGRGEDAAAPVAEAALERGLRDLGLEGSDPDQVALEEADFILSGGNGMRDMAGFAALAQALGAATGASRVAVDDGRFARARQIGATGKTVQASVYMALGISGAVQHLQGIKDCRHVIAVNLDQSAPIVKRANLTLVEDSGALMQALLQLVRAAQAAKSA